MKVALFYNKDAGEGLAPGMLRDQLTRGGHEIVRSIRRGTQISGLLDAPVELVVAAGGDGTIAAAARAVAGSEIPLAILPLGTANNIAESLDITAPLPELIESWKHAVRMPFDLGVAASTAGEILFVEGVGGGLIPAGIDADKRAGEDADAAPELRVAAAIGHFLSALVHLKPSRFELAVDGTDISGDFLVVEILNIRSIGPNLVLAPDADPSDGLFSVVTAGEEHRHALLSYLQDRLAGRPARLTLPCTQATIVTMRGSVALHFDDQTQSAKKLGALSLQVRPAALHVLKSAAG